MISLTENYSNEIYMKNKIMIEIYKMRWKPEVADLVLTILTSSFRWEVKIEFSVKIHSLSSFFIRNGHHQFIQSKERSPLGVQSL